ncbi:hypothetical protein [Tateyamaria omphalii]|uniref:hypothetical protein n=1 Tax=Tateyamaria omphalii TaxID=299262 RepID=UPI0012F7CD7A|nr:hypothetical protein [Tateyamaria omphalii]
MIEMVFRAETRRFSGQPSDLSPTAVFPCSFSAPVIQQILRAHPNKTGDRKTWQIALSM